MRLHELESIEPVLLDATEQLPFWKESFDKVLVDAPCSGTGTLRHNPEIRWRLAPSDFAALAEKQKRILAQAVQVLKPGGRLVYSTCSVEREENEEVIADCRLRPLQTIRTWPQRGGSDGFFVATFERSD
jgi:16S rRNA (cytosine967-C5)-methyltransferase